MLGITCRYEIISVSRRLRVPWHWVEWLGNHPISGAWICVFAFNPSLITGKTLIVVIVYSDSTVVWWIIQKSWLRSQKVPLLIARISADCIADIIFIKSDRHSMKVTQKYISSWSFMKKVFNNNRVWDRSFVYIFRKYSLIRQLQ